MRRFFYGLLAAGVFFSFVGATPLLLSGTMALVGPPEPEEPVAEEIPWEPLPPRTLTVAHPIPAGSTLGQVLQGRGVSSRAVREAALDLYDLAHIRPDRELQLVYRQGAERPVAVRYAIDEDTVVVVDREEDGWEARLEEVEYDIVEDVRAFTVRRSLWLDGREAGLRALDLVTLARIFEYEVDFNSELQPGAHFALVADIGSAEGRRDRLETVHAVRLVNGGEEVTAVRHVGADGEEAFYHPDGRGMKRPFLRSPLEFSRVTSGFDRQRFHPILERTIPHNGVDFGAATGTPVRAVADGRVTFSGRNGGHGNFVKLHHDRRYQTSYSHLSRIQVRRGQRVRQGDIIGEVGMTGLATGPHLHYQMWIDGAYVDPMEVDLPRTAPLEASERPDFEEAVERWTALLTR